jgi:2,4-diaminopentanoate dehydrogenase
MKKDTNTRLRVVQWATGNVGSRALRTIIEHPRLELVGLYVFSADKEGRDAGELCGLAPVGVKATRSVDEIVALKPDCVVYMQRWYDLEVVCRLLSSGVNIVTTRGEFHNPRMMDPAIRKRVELACQQGGTTIHSTGCSPGFITEEMPLLLASLQRRLDSVTVDEFANLARRDSPGLLFDVMGYGKTPAEFMKTRSTAGLEGFAHSFGVVIDALGLSFDNFDMKVETAIARNDVQILAGLIPKGRVAAQRVVVSCMRGGRPLMQMRLNWYCTKDIDADWELAETGWRVQMAGDMPLDVRINYPIAFEEYTAVLPGLTAHLPVNAIPFVCAASPGIKTTTDLPRIVAHLT